MPASSPPSTHREADVLAIATARLRAGGDVRIRDAEGRSLLGGVVRAACGLDPGDQEAFDRSLRVIGDLLEAGADPDDGAVAADDAGRAPLAEALMTTLRRPYHLLARSVAVAAALLHAGATPVRREDLDAHALLAQHQHLLADTCATVNSAMPASVAWRWDVQAAILMDRPFTDRVAVAQRPGWRGVVDRLLGAAEREVGPTMGDLAWASGWAAANPEHPQAMRLLALCGGAS